MYIYSTTCMCTGTSTMCTSPTPSPFQHVSTTPTHPPDHPKHCAHMCSNLWVNEHEKLGPHSITSSQRLRRSFVSLGKVELDTGEQLYWNSAPRHPSHTLHRKVITVPQLCYNCVQHNRGSLLFLCAILVPNGVRSTQPGQCGAANGTELYEPHKKPADTRTPVPL